MAEQHVGNTALGAATCRLIEQFQPEGTRLFDDPVVKDLVGGLVRALVWPAGMREFVVRQTDAVMQGIYGAQICRTRFIDDVVRDALAQGIEQLVVLGAGLDTRAYRLAGMERVKTFEVDLPSVQEHKKKRLLRHFGRLPEQVAFIPIDFDTQSLETAFAGNAFDPARPAIVVWEGVTQYISEEAVVRVLTFVGKMAPGSVLVFTYVLKSVIERRSDIAGADKFMDVVAKNRAAWVFGLEPSLVPSFLEPYHLRVIADVGNAEYQEKYLKPLGRTLVVSECERVVQAVVVRS